MQTATEMFHRGVDLQQRGLFDHAIEEYEKALELEPMNMDVMINLGAAYLQKGLAEKSSRILCQVLEVQPRNSIALFNLGKAYLYDERTADALTVFEMASELVSDDFELHKSICQCLIDLGRRKEAAERLYELRNQISGDPKWLMTLGALLFENGKTKEALEIYRKAATAACDSTRPIEGVLRCQLALGMKDKAMTSIKRAIMLDPRNPHFHIQMTDILVETGKLDEALSHLRTAVDAHPGIEPLKRKLEELNRRLPVLRKKNVESGLVARVSPFESEVYDILEEVFDGRMAIESAITRLTDIQVRDKTDLFVAEELANLLFQGREYKKAIRLFTDICSIEPYVAVHRIKLSRALALDGRVDDAFEVLTASDHEIPCNLEIKSALVEMMLLTKDFTGARDMIVGVVSQFPQAPHAMFLDGYISLRLGDTIRAKNVFEQVLEKHPNDEEVAAWYTRTCLIRGEASLAKGCWEKFNDDYESMVEVLTRVEIALATNQAGDVLPLLNRIGEYRPRFFEDHLLFGKAFFYAGDFSNAVKEFEMVLADDPENAEVLSFMALLHLFRNKHAKFWICWQRAVESDLLYAVIPPLVVRAKLNFTQLERLKRETSKLLELSGSNHPGRAVLSQFYNVISR